MLGANKVVRIEEPGGDASSDEVDSGVVSGSGSYLTRLVDPS